MLWLMFFGWLLTLPFFALTQGWNDLPALSLPGALAISFLGVFCSGVAYIFWFDALSAIDAAQASAFIYLEPFVTVVVATLVLGEALTPISLIGGVAIILGVYLVNRPAAPRLVVANAGD